MTDKIKREECHIGIYPCCIEFENGKVIRNCYACIEKYGYAKGVYAENQKNKKAWEEVLEELEELKKEFKNDRRIHEAIAVNISIKRIKEHLAEIEE